MRAPASGVVIFAGKFRSYGDLLIVDACNVVAVVGGLLFFDVAAGHPIEAGDTLASVRAAPSGEPTLYFEVRENGVPVDPDSLPGMK